MFTSLSLKDGGYVTFRDNSKGKIIDIGNVDNEPSSIIENVLLVDGLKYNLFSISQLCDKENRVIKDNKILFVGQKVENVYIFTIDDAPTYRTCFAAINDNGWL